MKKNNTLTYIILIISVYSLFSCKQKYFIANYDLITINNKKDTTLKKGFVNLYNDNRNIYHELSGEVLIKKSYYLDSNYDIDSTIEPLIKIINGLIKQYAFVKSDSDTIFYKIPKDTSAYRDYIKTALFSLNKNDIILDKDRLYGGSVFYKYNKDSTYYVNDEKRSAYLINYALPYQKNDVIIVTPGSYYDSINSFKNLLILDKDLLIPIYDIYYKRNEIVILILKNLIITNKREAKRIRKNLFLLNEKDTTNVMKYRSVKYQFYEINQ